MYKLKYSTIPEQWNDGLPIGNGRLAAMFWGDAKKDVLSLNHERLWRGKYRGKEAPKHASYLPELRKLLQNKDYFRAGVYANLFYGGLSGISGVGEQRIDSYQPAGNLVFEFAEGGASCESILDIINGEIRVYRDKSLSSNFFCDSADGSIMAKWKSEVGFSGLLYFERELDEEADYRISYKMDQIDFACTFICGVCYKVCTTFKTDGNISVTEKGLYIADATEIICSTNIVMDKEDEREQSLDFDILYKRHSERFSAVMNRVAFSLGKEEPLCITDECIAAYKNGAQDDKLMEFYFHYGRYLMVSSCICGSLPPNLQGKWNEKLQPEWKSDYHFDINLQMNEWMIESANCSEFAEPFSDFVLSFIKSGQIAAKNMFDCRGIWMPLACDVWAECTPESYGYAVWTGVAAWVAQHLWKHYIYTGDGEYLRTKAYRFFKEVALFYEDFLVEDENGTLQIMPSQSPENRFLEAGRLVVAGICSSSAIDVQLVHDALGYAIDSAKILHVDEESVVKWEAMRSKLPPFRIGSDGRLLEWNEEFTEEWPGYKHLSHLYGLYPSEIFTPNKRPAEYNAAVKSFRYRLKKQQEDLEGTGMVGWSCAWVANVAARIGDGETCYSYIADMMRRFTTSSLLDTHPYPPTPEVHIFQIDGNFGVVSAVIEALCSYFDGKAHLLHALPDNWEDGSIKGIKLPGGHTIGFSWNNGMITSGEVEIGFAKKVTLVLRDREVELVGEPGELVRFCC